MVFLTYFMTIPLVIWVDGISQSSSDEISFWNKLKIYTQNFSNFFSLCKISKIPPWILENVAELAWVRDPRASSGWRTFHLTGGAKEA